MVSSRKSWAIMLAMIGAALLGSAPAVHAQAFLDFNMDAVHSGASISYAGGVAPLVGTNISVDTVVGIGTPANAGVIQTITGGVLNFTTGNFSSSTSDTWNFTGGGTITVTGGVPGLGIVAGSTLLSGTFTNARVEVISGLTKITIAAFFDDKHPVLEAFYGLGGVPGWDGSMNLSFVATGSPPSAFTSSSVGSGDILNFPAPEPSSLVLLGIGGLGAFVYRRRQKAALAA